MTTDKALRAFDIGPLTQIPRGEGRNFEIDGRVVALFHTRAGEVYATQPDCPHRKGPLADGLLGGTTVVCPLHERAFDLRTGEEIGADCKLMTYPAKVTSNHTVVILLPD